MSLQRSNNGGERTKSTAVCTSENARQVNTKAGISNSNRDEAGTGSDAKHRANKFLRVHLQILEALYQQDASPETTHEDGRVGETYWNFIKSFLKERDACVALVQREQRMRGICDEAMEFRNNTNAAQLPAIDDEIIAHLGSPHFHRIGNRNRKHNRKHKHKHKHNKHAIKGVARSNRSRSSAAIVLITQPSPHYHSHRSPRARAWTGATSNRSGGRNQGENDDSDNEDGGNAFGIVSGLLKRKHRLASRQLNERTTNLRLLAKESQERIELLHSRLITVKDERNALLLQNSAISRENILETREEYEDCLVRIETKTNLWKLLLQDLTRIVK